ncbi:hypothetical protein DV737_g4688, partial [Chaetothyriales sp. CBS 132003]
MLPTTQARVARFGPAQVANQSGAAAPEGKWRRLCTSHTADPQRSHSSATVAATPRALPALGRVQRCPRSRRSVHAPEMQLEDWLDDLCVRFIINLPHEEANNVERLCFQVEEAQWFYEDFVRPLDPRLPSLSLKAFSLRIFQHCPVFRQWDARDRAQAFADFMAYKQRVPVRGAIMLNAAMDKVVLVKGWKKGANWSFPRGKINKDEDDMACAVREVYEETGFDVIAAGLVKDEKEMKSIDITMREQHMRLYVFRGVPEDTHFEPRTRKEISKIECPGKFYMVAPFLGPLKKWIHQQRKRDGARHSSGLAAPPMIAEESADDGPSPPRAAVHQQRQRPSDLPEVTAAEPDRAAPSPPPAQQQPQLVGIGPSQPPHLRQADAAKSTALLSLLKGPLAAEIGASAHPPVLQPSPHVASRPPYQLTGDPEFARAQQHETNAPPAVPPASALPKLTHHTRTLLDMFSTKPAAGPPPSHNTPAGPRQALLDVFQSAAGAADAGSGHQPLASHPAGAADAGSGHQPLASRPAAAILSHAKQPTFASVVSAPPQQGVKPDTASTSTARQQDLLGLFGAPAPATPAVPPQVEQARVELAATPEHQPKHDGHAMSPQHQPKHDEHALLALLRRQKADQAATQPHPGSTSKEGRTSANMGGPLNQPNFDLVARANPVEPNGKIRRSPLTTHRTLFDPNQPGPVRVMARPQTPRQPASTSPRAPKAKAPPPSPKRHARPSQKEPAKPFQPQILKRPQSLEGAPSLEPAVKALPMSRETPPAQERASAGIAPVHAQKQALLSLFGDRGGPSASSTAKTAKTAQTAQTPAHMVSPLSASHIVSSKGDAPVSAMEPAILTQPRVEPGLEKRQTAAEDKAFLLGMLGKIAQEQG